MTGKQVTSDGQERSAAAGDGLAALVRGFSGRRVLVVGDLIADQFVSGEISVPTRSATKVWSRPTVVAPASVLHAVPSIENVTFDA